jgi:hypothetical protein
VYFRLLLAHPGQRLPLTLLHLAFTDNEVRRRFLDSDWAYYQSEHLSRRCERLQMRIYACCAGLLEVNNIRLPKVRGAAGLRRCAYAARTKQDQRGPASYCRTVDFIHRSVADFKTDRGPDFFKDIDQRRNASLTLLDCELGLMSLFPDRISKQDNEGNS